MGLINAKVRYHLSISQILCSEREPQRARVVLVSIMQRIIITAGTLSAFSDFKEPNLDDGPR